ncbi:hypothetical protein K458DRAFT_311217, partial [Lentithecium fluviatile CBS 122367]
PPYSPDLNAIENILSILKDRLIKRKKKDLGVGTSKESINAFKRVILEEWNNIPQDAIYNCILSMPRRYRAVIEAKEWYNKY